MIFPRPVVVHLLKQKLNFAGRNGKLNSIEISESICKRPVWTIPFFKTPLIILKRPEILLLLSDAMEEPIVVLIDLTAAPRPPQWGAASHPPKDWLQGVKNPTWDALSHLGPYPAKKEAPFAA